jgi:hypothetical protein
LAWRFLCEDWDRAGVYEVYEAIMRSRSSSPAYSSHFAFDGPVSNVGALMVLLAVLLLIF